MVQYDKEFSRNFRMNHAQFEELFQRLRHRLDPKKLSRPDVITARERLSFTLEYVFIISKRTQHQPMDLPFKNNVNYILDF